MAGKRAAETHLDLPARLKNAEEEIRKLKNRFGGAGAAGGDTADPTYPFFSWVTTSSGLAANTYHPFEGAMGIDPVADSHFDGLRYTPPAGVYYIFANIIVHSTGGGLVGAEIHYETDGPFATSVLAQNLGYGAVSDVGAFVAGVDETDGSKHYVPYASKAQVGGYFYGSWGAWKIG